jgi:tRNA(fMet)-specific endonuclease VapC
MYCLDTSFLVDYLYPRNDHHDDAKAYLEARRDRAFYVPIHVFYEIYRYVAWNAGDPDEAIARTEEALSWTEPLEETPATAREAARIARECKDRGRPINRGDELIAGTVREAGGMLVTRDGDFEDVPDLAVEQYTGSSTGGE